MSLSVKYIDAPEGAQEEATVHSEDGQLFGDSLYLSGGGFVDTPWASLEPSSWALDGSRKLLPDAPKDVGWWSKERSGEDGRFENPPVIRFHISPINARYDATGLTFQFWPSLGHWCSEMRVTWYYEEWSEDGSNYKETVVAETTAYPNDANWALAQEVKGFNRIDIELLATNIPGQFAKLQHIQIGQVFVFLENELLRVSLLNETDPSACELIADELTVEIYDRKDRRLRPHKNQPVQLYRNGEIVASHYIEECTQEDRNHYVFRCQSAIARLEDTFLGGFYKDEPLFDILSNQVLKGIPFSLGIPANTRPTITGYLPVSTRREALQQIAFAIGAVVTTRKDGFVDLSPMEEDVTAVFTKGDIFTGAKLTQEPQVATIQVTAHRYTKPRPEEEETETLLDGVEVLGKDILFTFSEPHYDYVDNLSAMGSEIETGDNWVKITAKETETVTLTAKKYVHSKQIYSRTNEAATAAEKGNVVKVENATLIHAGNVNDTLDRLEAYHKLKNVLSQSVVVDGQKVGQKAESINPWGTLTVGYITSMESEFTGTGHTASVTIRGVEVSTSEAEVLQV